MNSQLFHSLCLAVGMRIYVTLVCRESLYEDEGFDQRQLAALLVSKVI